MTESDSAWDALLTAVLLGTERRPPALAKGGGALGAALEGLDRGDPPRLLLQGAALLALYRQAGSLPPVTPAPEGQPCPAEEKPRCRPAAAARLAGMLGGQHPELIPEWLALAAAAGQRVPEELLAGLLEWGEANRIQIDLILPVLGRRGRWLAGLAPWAEYTAAVVSTESIPAAAAESAWQMGRRPVRSELLYRLRRTDPALALQLLASTWKVESAEDRAAFLEALRSGLSMAEEPFLENALDDRSKEVRKVAADLLSHLGGSRLVQRQLQRAQACLKWIPGGFLKKARLEVILPEACDKAMQRDGVEPKRAIRSLGEKADWLLQILRAVPPSVWSSQWAKSPAELLEIGAAGEWKELLHEGWIGAAACHRDPEWAEVILAQYPFRPSLLDALPQARRAAFIAARLRQKPAPEGCVGLLRGYEEPWGAELTRLALPHLRGYYTDKNNAAHFYSLQQSFVNLGQFMEPALGAEIGRALADPQDPGSAWNQALERLLQILDFRYQMKEELR